MDFKDNTLQNNFCPKGNNRHRFSWPNPGQSHSRLPRLVGGYVGGVGDVGGVGEYCGDVGE